MSEKNIKDITKRDSNFAPTFVDHHVLPDMTFNGYCLIIEKVINLYISHTLNPWLRNLITDFTLKNCLFGSVKLTKNADPHRYKNIMVMAQDLILVQNFHLQMEAWKKMSLLFGADMSSSVLIDNKNKAILIVGEGST